jgi:hypothetical protein
VGRIRVPSLAARTLLQGARCFVSVPAHFDCRIRRFELSHGSKACTAGWGRVQAGRYAPRKPKNLPPLSDGRMMSRNSQQPRRTEVATAGTARRAPSWRKEDRLVAEEPANPVVNACSSRRMPRSPGRVRCLAPGMLENQQHGAVNTVMASPAWFVFGPSHTTARVRHARAPMETRTRPHRTRKTGPLSMPALPELTTHGYPGGRSRSHGGVVAARKRGALVANNSSFPEAGAGRVRHPPGQQIRGKEDDQPVAGLAFGANPRPRCGVECGSRRDIVPCAPRRLTTPLGIQGLCLAALM